ncbi:MAG: fatty acyl-AMP ligase [Acidobacteria bacterium]|nr:fatty acyl-AMP ligase [Acidobacteriota bacterium]
MGTLNELLLRRAQATPDAPHLYLGVEDGQPAALTYGQLLEGAQSVAAGLLARGIRPRDTVALMLPTDRNFFFAFFGVLLAGSIPVPIYPPVRADQIEEYARRQSAILANAGVKAMVTFREAERLAHLLKPRIPSLAAVVTADQLAREKLLPTPCAGEPGDIGLIQYTSGSTGDPRGVALTHGNVLANVRAIGQGVQVRSSDVTVCWLPLYHDMGLIGCWFFSLYFGLPIVAMSPLAFLRRPERWLWAIHRYRGSLSPAPNFAYELCARKVSDQALEGLDLSSWRVALNGAEPVSPDTLARFMERFARYGFRAEAMMPVYGLAESSVALSFAPLGRPPRIDRVAREPFQRYGRAEPAPASNPDPLQFVSVGRALPEHEVRLVDDADRPVGERVEGHLQFRGPSAMQGYYRNPEATAAAQYDAWFRTGDLAYLADGELFITGRTKDLIIKAGRNICPQEIEEIAADVPGVRRGCVAAFGVAEPRTGTEGLVLVAETRETDATVRARLASEISKRVGAAARISPDVVKLVPPQTLPKTPSGKLRRGECRKLYLSGTLGQLRPPAWLQVTRLVTGNALVSVKQAVERLTPAPLKQLFVPAPPEPPESQD